MAQPIGRSRQPRSPGKGAPYGLRRGEYSLLLISQTSGQNFCAGKSETVCHIFIIFPKPTYPYHLHCRHKHSALRAVTKLIDLKLCCVLTFASRDSFARKCCWLPLRDADVLPRSQGALFFSFTLLKYVKHLVCWEDSSSRSKWCLPAHALHWPGCGLTFRIKFLVPPLLSAFYSFLMRSYV